MNKSNETSNISIFEYEYIDEESNQSSYGLSNQLNQVNSILTIIIIVFGLIGHSLTIFVYSQNRFRRNSSNIYFLCLALNDSAYLIIHPFKDTIRSFIKDDKFQNFIQMLNLIDRFEMTCRLINYLRNVLRFTSAYIVVVFTLQRLFIVYSPMSNKFKSKKSAWKTVALIYFISLLSNSYTLFIFDLQIKTNNKTSCRINPSMDNDYFHLTIVFNCIIMLIPIIIIFTSNSFLISNICKNTNNNLSNKMILSNNKNKTSTRINKKSLITTTTTTTTKNNEQIIKPYFLTINQIINRITQKANNTRKLTKMLILISFSYAFLNLPYFLAWSLFYDNDRDDEYKKYVKIEKLIQYNYSNSAVKICELFSVLNYGIYFYIYFLSGSMFRNQLKYSSIII
jgi:hypothetical protein